MTEYGIEFVALIIMNANCVIFIHAYVERHSPHIVWEFLYKFSKEKREKDSHE